MTRTKFSAMLDPRRLEQARAVTGTTNLSRLLDDALGALIERRLEQRWLDAYSHDDLPGEVPVDISTIPWEDQ